MDWPTFLDVIVASILEPQWATAATGYQGGGLDQGFHVEQVRRQMKYYEKLDLPVQKSMLQSTCSGAIWPRYRLFMEGMVDDPICPRCEHISPQVETEYHRYWACPDNCTMDHPDVVSSQYLIPRAQKLSEKLHYIDGAPVIMICTKEYEGGTSTKYRIMPHPQEALWCRGLPLTKLMDPNEDDPSYAVSYTHLTLPTKRIV